MANNFSDDAFAQYTLPSVPTGASVEDSVRLFKDHYQSSLSNSSETIFFYSLHIHLMVKDSYSTSEAGPSSVHITSQALCHHRAPPVPHASHPRYMSLQLPQSSKVSEKDASEEARRGFRPMATSSKTNLGKRRHSAISVCIYLTSVHLIF
jgi:hypothetical protein